jgi:AcrR family transcriptional regulator
MSASPWVRRKPRDNHFAEKRDAVLKQAAALFAERGYDSVSLNELADSLNITKPTLYYYFKSKNEILLEIQGQAQDEVLGEIEDAKKFEGTGLERLEYFLSRYIDTVISDSVRCLANAKLDPRKSGRAGQINDRIKSVEKSLIDFFQQGMQDGTIKRQDVRILYHATFGMLNSLAVWYKQHGPVKRQQMAEQIVSLLVDGMRST